MIPMTHSKEILLTELPQPNDSTNTRKTSRHWGIAQIKGVGWLSELTYMANTDKHDRYGRYVPLTEGKSMKTTTKLKAIMVSWWLVVSLESRVLNVGKYNLAANMVTTITHQASSWGMWTLPTWRSCYSWVLIIDAQIIFFWTPPLRSSWFQKHNTTRYHITKLTTPPPKKNQHSGAAYSKAFPKFHESWFVSTVDRSWRKAFTQKRWPVGWREMGFLEWSFFAHCCEVRHVTHHHVGDKLMVKCSDLAYQSVQPLYGLSGVATRENMIKDRARYLFQILEGVPGTLGWQSSDYKALITKHHLLSCKGMYTGMRQHFMNNAGAQVWHFHYTTSIW